MLVAAAEISDFGDDGEAGGGERPGSVKRRGRPRGGRWIPATRLRWVLETVEAELAHARAGGRV